MVLGAWLNNFTKNLHKPDLGKWKLARMRVLLITLYIVGGAYLFRYIEFPAEWEGKNATRAAAAEIEIARTELKENIRNLTSEYLSRGYEELITFPTTPNNTWAELRKLIEAYHEKMKDAIENGYDGTVHLEEEEKYGWSIASAILFTASILTTIGYGHVCPKSDTGQLVTIGYSVLAIPLMSIFLTKIATFLIHLLTFVYQRCFCAFCSKRRLRSYGYSSWDEYKNIQLDDKSKKNESDENSLSALLVILLTILYCVLGAVIFWAWITDCVVTLTTIGFGDYVPGMEQGNTTSGKLLLGFTAVYVIVGLAVLAICIAVSITAVMRIIRNRKDEEWNYKPPPKVAKPPEEPPIEEISAERLALRPSTSGPPKSRESVASRLGTRLRKSFSKSRTPSRASKKTPRGEENEQKSRQSPRPLAPGSSPLPNSHLPSRKLPSNRSSRSARLHRERVRPVSKASRISHKGSKAGHETRTSASRPLRSRSRQESFRDQEPTSSIPNSVHSPRSGHISSKSQRSSSKSPRLSSTSPRPPSKTPHAIFKSLHIHRNDSRASPKSPRPPSQSPRPSSNTLRPSLKSPRPPSKSPRSSLKSPRPPTKSPQPPSKSTRFPSKSPQQPSETPRSPSNSALPPSKSPKLPSKSPRKPSKSPRPLYQSPRSPSKSQTSLSKLSHPPYKSPRPPSKSPRKLSETPSSLSKSTLPSSETQKPLSKASRTLSKSPRITSKSPRAPSKSRRPSSKSPRSPSKSPRPTLKSPRVVSTKSHGSSSSRRTRRSTSSLAQPTFASSVREELIKSRQQQRSASAARPITGTNSGSKSPIGRLFSRGDPKSSAASALSAPRHSRLYGSNSSIKLPPQIHD